MAAARGEPGYGPDGRRLNQDGRPSTPTTPGTYWGDVFKRSLITRLGASAVPDDTTDATADAGERFSVSVIQSHIFEFCVLLIFLARKLTVRFAVSSRNCRKKKRRGGMAFRKGAKSLGDA